MKNSKIQIILSKLDGFLEPNPELEQYMTSPEVATKFVNIISLNEEKENSIADFGSGTGILSIALGLKGFKVKGIEKDKEAVKKAEQNLKKAEKLSKNTVDVKFLNEDVLNIEHSSKVVLMNPPFGIQEEDRNLDFLEKSFENAERVYALLHSSEEKTQKTRQFLKEFAARHNFSTQILRSFRFRIPRTMEFHELENKYIDTDMYFFERKEVVKDED